MREIDISGETLITPKDRELPVLGWAEVAKLVIDDTYQRPLGKSNWTQIRKIAQNFSWSRFAPIMIAPIADGRFAVIDGQHRVHAAALCGLIRVPAVVVDIDSKEQASTFSHVNGTVTRITIFHVYKAALAAGEEWAVKAERAVTGGGCQLMVSNASTNDKKAGQIYAIGLIRDLVEKGHEKAVITGLQALRDYDETERVALYSAVILRPWLTAIAQSESFLDLDLCAFLKKNDPFKVINRVARLREKGELKGTSVAKLNRMAFVTLMKHFNHAEDETST